MLMTELATKHTKTFLENLENWTSPTNTSALSGISLKDADREKVGPHFLHLLKTSNGFTSEDEAAEHRILHKRNVLRRELELILTDATHIPMGLLRGFGIQNYYPDQYVRQFNDIDIVVPSIGALEQLTAQLVRLGHRIVRPIVYRGGVRQTVGSRWMGLAFNKTVDDLPEPVMVDVVVGGPGISPLFHYELQESAWKFAFDKQKNGQYPIFPVNETFIILIVEAFEREKLTIRDFVDFCVLTQNPQFNWETVRTVIKNLCLEQELARFAEGFRRLQITPPVNLYGVPNPRFDNNRELQRFMGHNVPLIKSGRGPNLWNTVFYFLVGESIFRWLEQRYPNRAIQALNWIKHDKWVKNGFPVYAIASDCVSDGVLMDWTLNQHKFVGKARPIFTQDEWDAAWIGGNQQ